MIGKNIEAALLAEGLSAKTQNFAKLIDKIMSYEISQLFSIIRSSMEGVLPLPLTEDKPLKASTAPKVEIAEVVRGQNHRVIKIGTQLSDGKPMVLWSVVPIADPLSGEELNDADIKSRVQDKIKNLYNDLATNQDASNDLQTLFKNEKSALSQLEQLDGPIQDPSEPQKLDTNRTAIVPYIKDAFPENAEEAVQVLTALKQGQLENSLKEFEWDDGTKSLFTKKVAGGMAQHGLEDALGDEATRYAAGVALACITMRYLS